jgi:uncharacterized protein
MTGFKFLVSAAVFSVAILSVQVLNAQRAPAKKPAEQKLPYPIIDAHVHVEFEKDAELEELTGFPNTKEEFLAQTKAAGVVGFVAHLASETAALPQIPGLTSVYCAGVSDKINLEAIEKGLKEKQTKCIKIYLGYVHRFAYDAAYHPVYRLAEKYGVPVVFHTGDTDSANAKLKYSDPLTVDDVAVDFRGVTFVLAHMGNPWINSAAEVAYKNPNVYMDASALVIGDLSKLSRADTKRFVIDPVSWSFGYIENAEKMMFGTDWPLVRIKDYLTAILPAIPVADRKAFFHDNAAKIFKITPSVEIRAPASAPGK